MDIGDIYAERGNSDEAIKNYDKAILIGKELEINFNLYDFLYRKVLLLFKLDRIEKLDSMIKEALEIAIKIVDSK